MHGKKPDDYENHTTTVAYSSYCRARVLFELVTFDHHHISKSNALIHNNYIILIDCAGYWHASLPFFPVIYSFILVYDFSIQSFTCNKMYEN